MGAGFVLAMLAGILKSAAKPALRSRYFEVGVDLSIVVVDAGKARSMTTTTMKDDVYAFTFRQKGLMAGLGLQGSTITKVNK